VGCNDRANAGHGQKTRRPEGFRGKGRLASLLLGHRPLRVLARAARTSLVAPRHAAFSPKTGLHAIFRHALRAEGPKCYSPDRRIEYSLLRRFWLVARREEGSIAAALCDPTSNDATSQNRRNPPGQGRFALRLRCSLSRVSLRIHSIARASPQSKTALANCILSCGLGSTRGAVAR